MTVGELRKLLSTFNQDEKIFIWRGNGHTWFDYTSNIEISRPYGNSDTNKGNVNHPLILSHSYELDLKDERKLRLLSR